MAQMGVLMIKENASLWGRDFSLSLLYRCRPDEDVLDSQLQAKNAILDNWSAVEEAKQAVESYCLDRDGDVIGDSIENIFKYVIPTGLFVLRDESARKVALMCNYRFDPEHGIAVVFKNEKLLEVIPQDEL